MKSERLYYEERANVKKNQKGDTGGQKGDKGRGKSAFGFEPLASPQGHATGTDSGHRISGAVLLCRRSTQLARRHGSDVSGLSKLVAAFSLFRIAEFWRPCRPFRIQLSAPGGRPGTFASVADGEYCARSG